MLLALAGLAACGGSSNPAALKNEAFAAMASGDAGGSVAKFDELLEGIDKNAPDFIEVSVGRCQALAAVDPEKCQTDFLALAGNSGNSITDKDYSAVVSHLVSNKEFTPAIMIMHDGMKRFPESPNMQKLLESVTAASSKDPAAKSLMGGLGYLGD
ncbi:MAG: hypothetical protein ACI841_005092 [Planctomycetota bacterium]|jgi:hypothetical protein